MGERGIRGGREGGGKKREEGGGKERGGSQQGQRVCLENLGRPKPDLCPFEPHSKELRVFFPGRRLFLRNSWERTPPHPPTGSLHYLTLLESQLPLCRQLPAPKPFTLIKPLSQCAGWWLADSRASAPFRNRVFPRILTSPCWPQGQSQSWLLPEPAQGMTALQVGSHAASAGGEAGPWGHSSQLCLIPLGKWGSDRDVHFP